jgi:hypothetical protein
MKTQFICLVLLSVLSGAYASAQWVQTNEPFSGQVYALAMSGLSVFAGTAGGGFFLSTNNGTSWTAANMGVTSQSIQCLAFDGTNLFAGNTGGVWRRTLSEMITSAEPSVYDIPGEFVLHHNYPNSFNPSTTIKYELSKSTEVRLMVYDMLGREVSVLVNERRDPGVHEVTFDGSGLSTGVYFCSLTAGDLVATKRLLLLK